MSVACQVSHFSVYNVLVICQVSICAKFSFSCDQEVIQEDALRTSSTLSPQCSARNVAIVLCFKEEIFEGM